MGVVMWAACRGVQNMLIGSGTGKVQSVVEICDRLLAEFDGVTRSKTRPTILVMGPWTGPRSKEDFVVAAKLLDAALVDRSAREGGRGTGVGRVFVTARRTVR